MNICPAVMARLAKIKHHPQSPQSRHFRPRSFLHSLCLGLFVTVGIAWFHRWRHLVVVVGSPDGTSEDGADTELLLGEQKRTHLRNRTKAQLKKKKNETVNAMTVYLNETKFQIPRIPRTLVFTHKTNLLDPKKADPKEQKFYLRNIMKTIRMYARFWKNETVSVWFLDNPECDKVLRKVFPRLIPYFRSKTVEGKFKGDLCRAAVLYMSGGYYFDADMKALKPVALHPNTTFSSAKSSQGFFNSYMAAAPGNPILLESLDIALRYYMNGTHEKDVNRKRISHYYGQYADHMYGTQHYGYDDDDADDDEDEEGSDDEEKSEKKYGEEESDDEDVDDEDDEEDDEFNLEEEVEMAIGSAIYMIKERGLVGPFSLWGAYEAAMRRQQYEMEKKNCDVDDLMPDYDLTGLEPVGLTASERRAARNYEDEQEYDDDEEDNDEDGKKKKKKAKDDEEDEEKGDELQTCDEDPQTVRNKFSFVESSEMLYEEDFGKDNKMRRKQFPRIKFQDYGDGPNCNYVVHNDTHVFFFSRFVGAGGHGHCDFSKAYYRRQKELELKRLNSSSPEKPKPLRAVRPRMPTNVRLVSFSRMNREAAMNAAMGTMTK